jgi:hypothetical protein
MWLAPGERGDAGGVIADPPVSLLSSDDQVAASSPKAAT